MNTTIVNIRKAELQKRGICDFKEWNKSPNTLYIGRYVEYVKANKSKWSNPFSVAEYGRDECLVLYETYIRDTPKLYDNLHELQDKELGCWCKPEECHGDVLIRLLDEKLYSN